MPRAPPPRTSATASSKKIIDDYCYMKVVEIVPTIGITTGVSNMNYCSTYNLYVDYMNVALNG